MKTQTDRPSPYDLASALEKVTRDDWGRLAALLIRDLGDFQLAEDCLQDAAESALVHWNRNGVPRVPAAWLLQTARRKAIDKLRRDKNFRLKEPEIAALIELDQETAMEPETTAIPDERLSLIYTCCHPALDEKTRVALTLRTVAGLTTGEIARAFLDTEVTMAQRLVRAKQKIKLAGIPYQVPGTADLSERTDTVLRVIYLVFNEGYAATTGADRTRGRLCEEAIRLARILCNLSTGLSEASGLLALMLLNAARLPARIAADGSMEPLDAQDRSLWNAAQIAEGQSLVASTLGPNSAGPYLLQAAISALHCEAQSHVTTDWTQIAALYDELLMRSDNPVIALNRAVAVSYAQSVAAGLAALEPLIHILAAYQPLHAARADVLRRAGHFEEAKEAYARAISLSANASERAFLEKRARSLPNGQ
jgi:RNA polymerase sigma-70 factor, ECF subfamily